MMTPNCTAQRRLSFMCLTKNKINRVFIDKNLRLFLEWINIFQQVKKVILLRGAMMSKGWGRLGCTAEKSKQNKTQKTCIKLKKQKTNIYWHKYSWQQSRISRRVECSPWVIKNVVQVFPLYSDRHPLPMTLSDAFVEAVSPGYEVVFIPSTAAVGKWLASLFFWNVCISLLWTTTCPLVHRSEAKLVCLWICVIPLHQRFICNLFPSLDGWLNNVFSWRRRFWCWI